MNNNRFKAKLSLFSALVMASFTFLSANASNDFSQFWLPPQAQHQSYDQQSGGFEVRTQYTNKLADRSRTVLARDSVVASLISTDTTLGRVSIASSYSDKEYSSAMAASFGAVSLYTNTGRGESYSRNLSNYNGLDPYAFHGGNLVDYRYFGTSLGYSFDGDNAIQFGQTTVEADRLEDRRSSFVDFSNQRLFARYTHIERGDESVAFGLDAGVNFGRFNLGYQQLSSRYDISTKRVRLNWNKDAKNRFWLDVSNHRNAALSAYNDSTIMLSWQHSFGKQPTISFAVDENGEQEPKKAKKSNRGIYIGGAIAAAAILASSGSSGQDNAVRQAPSLPATPVTPGAGLVRNVQAQHDAARRQLNSINPVSVRENVEFGGYVYQLLDGSYASTEPVRGEAASVTLLAPSIAVPNGTFARASYHTHAGPDPRFDNENFSPTDLESDRTQNLDGYLGTPGGQLKFHEVSTGNISTIGTINNGS